MAPEFGAYRTTQATRWRPERSAFEPRFRVDASLLADLLAIDQADRDLRRYEADERVARRILRDALARNTFGTVSIEGNPITLDRVRSLLAGAPSDVTAVHPDERDVLNLASFLADLDAHLPPRSPQDLEALHARLFQGTVRDPGRFKQVPNFIGRAADRVVVYVPTAPERVEQELMWALDWHHAAREHAVVRAAVFFHEFQSIHPFGDGNGRLGRAVTALQLHHAGYPTVRYATVDFAINQDRDAYYAALGATQGGEWDLTPWLRYFARVLRGALEDAQRRFLFQDTLPGGLDERAVDVAMWVARLDRAVPGRRVMLADIQAAFPQITRRTLQRDLAGLVEAGVLDLVGHGRGASYSMGASVRAPNGA